ncbi:MAG TPA: undecaprenyl-diphosphate phosphatase [Pirellulaceae bacterium]|nr:undecaprenyl-diphosphate phosphatase [Pirellulaceae bacterium]
MPFSWWQILILAVLQGVAEFLPISSSGHLVVLAPLLFGTSEAPTDMTAVTVALHIGTLGSILVYYNRRIARLLGEDRGTLGLIVIGSIPAAVVGLLIELGNEQIIEQPLLAGCMLPVTGGVLLWMSRRPAGTTEYRDMSWRSALVVGLSQAAAILPGLSRSGLTIAAGVGTGLSRASAAAFSFLLAIPVIGGAGLLKLLLTDQQPATPVSLLFMGGGVAFIVGIAALWCLDRMLQRGRLHWFAWYCIALGLAVIAWQLSAIFNP